MTGSVHFFKVADLTSGTGPRHGCPPIRSAGAQNSSAEKCAILFQPWVHNNSTAFAALIGLIAPLQGQLKAAWLPLWHGI
jgi:hypothetical protein